MHRRWSEAPLVALTCCLALGIAISKITILYSFACFALAELALIGAAFLSLKRERLTLSVGSGLAAILLCGLMLGIAQRDAFPDQHIRALLSHSLIPLGESTLFDGCVAGEPEQRGDEILTPVDLRGVRNKEIWIACRGTALVRMPEVADGAQIPGAGLRYGDRVRGWAEWDLPRNYLNPGSPDRVGSLARRGISLIGRVKSPRLLEIISHDCESIWTRSPIAVRERVRANLDRIRSGGNGAEAAVLASVVVGDYSQLDTPTREIFQNSGTYHVLVVSGLHVGFIAWVLMHLLRFVGFSERSRSLVLALAILAYTSVVGFQASISRSLWMLILYLGGRSLFRRALPINIAMASAFLLLSVRPDWLFDVGFQLSFLSVVAICLTGLPLIDGSVRPWLDSLRQVGNPDRLFLSLSKAHRRGRSLRVRCELLAETLADYGHPRLERCLVLGFRAAASIAIWVGSMILISLSVQIWLSPLLAYHFNRLSWISPLANLAVVPLSSLLLAVGAVAVMATDLPLVGILLLRAAASLASLFLSITSWFSQVPGGWQRCPTPPFFWVFAGLLLLFVWSFLKWRRIWIPLLLIGPVLFSLSSGLHPLGDLAGRRRTAAKIFGKDGSPARVLGLTFLDVGQGDSLVIRFPDSRVWVLDAGGLRESHSDNETQNTLDIGEAVVSRYLWSLWVSRLDRIILSHPHQDHAGGIPALIRNFPTERLEYGEPGPDSTLDQLRLVAEKGNVTAHRVEAEQEQRIADVLVRILNPPNDGVHRSINDNSVVLQLEFGRFSALLTGDLERPGEVELLAREENLRGLILKVAHHGSRSATLDPFLDKARPRWAILSAGRNNPFGHPSREVLLRLLHHGARPLLTLDHGAISFETDGTRYVLSSYAAGVLETGTL